MAVAFDPSNVTSKVDFGALVDLSQLHGLNILITGGANGIGAAIARQFCGKGAVVTIADLSYEAGSEIEKELRRSGHHATFVKTDVTDWSSQVNAFKIAIRQSRSQSLDLVIPCAGLPGISLPLQKTVSLDEDPPPPPTSTIDVNLTGVYFSTCLALHYFRLPSSSPTKNPRKHLLFISSLAGYLEVPPVADYTASKFGVRGLWKSVRQEARDLGLRTNLIGPTFMRTQMISQVVSELEGKGAKIGKIDDVVEAIVRLACDNTIDGRAIGVGAFGNFDLRDDYEGLDGGIETLAYFKSGAMNGGMHHFKDVLAGRVFNK